MGRNDGTWLVAALLLAGMLAGCSAGDGGSSLPETYTVGEETLPALGAAQESADASADGSDEEASMPDVICQTQTNEETGETVYTYSGLENGLDTAKTYLQTLVNENGFSAIDQDGIVQETPELTAEEGSFLVGKETEDQTGLMELDVQWTENLCEVTASLKEGMRLQTPEEEQAEEQTLTVEQAVQKLQDMDPAELGVTDSPDSDVVFAEDGYALVDGQECYRLNRYTESAVGTPVISGTYLLSLNGEKLYRLDRDTNAVTLLQG